MSALNEHKRSDKIKWFVVFALIIALFALVAYSIYFSLYLYYEGNIPGIMPNFAETSVNVPTDTSMVTSNVISATSTEPATESGALTEPTTDVAA